MTKTISIPRAIEPRTIGTWQFWRSDQLLTANFICPGCGWLAVLADHDIAPDGEVWPSVVCPNDDCDFHEFIRLEGWDPEVFDGSEED